MSVCCCSKFLQIKEECFSQNYNHIYNTDTKVKILQYALQQIEKCTFHMEILNKIPNYWEMMECGGLPKLIKAFLIKRPYYSIEEFSNNNITTVHWLLAYHLCYIVA